MTYLIEAKWTSYCRRHGLLCKTFPMHKKEKKRRPKWKAQRNSRNGEVTIGQWPNNHKMSRDKLKDVNFDDKLRS